MTRLHRIAAGRVYKRSVITSVVRLLLAMPATLATLTRKSFLNTLWFEDPITVQVFCKLRRGFIPEHRARSTAYFASPAVSLEWTQV